MINLAYIVDDDEILVFLTKKLMEKDPNFRASQAFYNGHRVHSALGGQTPGQRVGQPASAPLSFQNLAWQAHCRKLFQTPVAV